MDGRASAREDPISHLPGRETLRTPLSLHFSRMHSNAFAVEATWPALIWKTRPRCWRFRLLPKERNLGFLLAGGGWRTCPKGRSYATKGKKRERIARGRGGARGWETLCKLGGESGNLLGILIGIRPSSTACCVVARAPL